jgi:rubredoxin
MATAPDDAGDDLIDQFFTQRGHAKEGQRWEQSYNKRQCPDCGGINEADAAQCAVCGWTPTE